MTIYRFEVIGRINAETVDDAIDILRLQLDDIVIDSKVTLFDGG
jgi:hypothetical protein